MYVLYYSIGKNHGDPYYEPTIVVHDQAEKHGIAVDQIIRIKKI